LIKKRKPSSKTEEKIKEMSRLKYGRPREEVEKELMDKYKV